MGSGQSVHLVVEMWRDIPHAKLKVKKMTPLVAFKSVTNQLSTLQNLQNDSKFF